MTTKKYTAQRREVGSSRNLPKSLSTDSEPKLTGKTGHQWTQLLLTVSQIEQFCTHVLGLNKTLTCWSVKMVKSSSVDRARAIGHLEAGWKQRDVAVLFSVSQSTISKLRLHTGIHMTWRIGQEVGDHISPQSGSFNSPGDWQIIASLHAAYRCAISDFMAVEIPESCPEASPNSWSNNWVNWWPVLPVSCGSLLSLRDFGKFQLDPPLFSEPYLSLWSWHWGTITGTWKGIDTPMKWCNRLMYKPINPWTIAPQSQFSELLLLSLYCCYLTQSFYRVLMELLKV